MIEFDILYQKHRPRNIDTYLGRRTRTYIVCNTIFSD